MTRFARRWIRFTFLAAALALPAVAFAAEVVKMGELPSISNVGLYVAMDKGYFEARGITVIVDKGLLDGRPSGF